MIAFDLRMYEYILLFFQLFVGFKIFHSKLKEGRKGKGSLDFWYMKYEVPSGYLVGIESAGV